MIEAIIIDDERSALITLSNDLQTYCPEVRVQASFTKAADALAHLRRQVPDLIFLDIDMPVMNGFDLVRELPQPSRAHIIFVSAYSEFAIKAFKVSALDYLLKPVVPAELQAAVQKVLDKKGAPTDQTLLLKNFADNAAAERNVAAGGNAAAGGPKAKIAFPVNDGYHLIDPDHILYCKAAGAYTEIVLDNEKSILISKTLGRTQELMPSDHFERVHQSYLVNLNHIKKFRKGESPSAIMANSDVVKVSRLNKDRLAQLLGIG